jgi:hypothetical protein
MERVQRNREIDQLAVIRVTIDPEAEPGMRELRLVTPIGASNPVRFMVGTLPEVFESEPNDQESPEQSLARPPFILNGQVMPGDVDHFSFEAVEGQHLVIHAMARELVPYLADAVPGWFQAVMTIHDNEGNEVAYADDYRFNPDPVLFFIPPETGTYHLSIHDSIYRGREDFVYRIQVGELPFITSIYPLGGQSGQKTLVKATGWNLPSRSFRIGTKPDGPEVRTTRMLAEGVPSNEVPYAVDAWPEFHEGKGNKNFTTAGEVSIPAVVNGRIETDGDADYYAFTANKDETLRLEVVARRLNSPLDSLIRVFDEAGQVIAWNDDPPKSSEPTSRKGLQTHRSDSVLEMTSPRDGTYFVQITDSRSHGGSAFAYRLRIENPQPDYNLFVTSSALNSVAGGTTRIRAHLERLNGFAGPVQIRLKNAPKGMWLSGQTIPAGATTVDFTLKTPPNLRNGMHTVQLTGIADINGRKVAKPAIPADDVTQAFITHHLVESDELLLCINRRSRRPPVVQYAGNPVMELTAGQSCSLDLKTGQQQVDWDNFKLELAEAPEGVSMEAVLENETLRLQFTAGPEIEPGLEGNLIVAISTEFDPGPKKDGTPRPVRKVNLGVIPAIPYHTQ